MAENLQKVDGFELSMMKGTCFHLNDFLDQTVLASELDDLNSLDSPRPPSPWRLCELCVLLSKHLLCAKYFKLGWKPNSDMNMT